MKNKFKIILSTVHRFNNRAGGTEKVICEMANALTIMGHDLTILYCDEHRGKPFFPLNKNVTLANTFIEIPFFSRQLFRNFISFFSPSDDKLRKRKEIECKWKSKNILKFLTTSNLKPDIIICFDFESTYIFKELLRLSIPIIATLQTAPILAFQNNKNQLFYSAINNCAALHVLMPEFAEDCRKLFPTIQIISIPNCIPNFHANTNYSLKKIICVSRFDPEKRPELLVRAFALLKDSYPDWTVEFWGRYSNQHTNKIKNLIKNLGLEDRFFLKGVTSEIHLKLSEASIFAIPSKYEGFCISLIEAMSCGLPSIGASDCPAINSLISHNNTGYLTDPTPEAFAAGLEELMKNTSKREEFGQKAKLKVKDYNENTVWSQWNSLIQNIITRS